MEKVKLVVFVPSTHAQVVRDAIAEAGGGREGKYSHCSFSVKGVGRFLPETGAHPAIGKVGVTETVEEERIEVLCDKSDVKEIVKAIKTVHPYEEVPIQVYPLLFPDAL